jgi:hypothetical protein
MDIKNPIILTAIIAASAALGSAFFAFVAAAINARVARNNAILSAQIAQRIKRADFRQAWIDKLRENLSSAHIGFEDSKGLSKEDATHAMRALMLVNRNDQDYERLTNCIAKKADKSGMSEDDVSDLNKEFLLVSQDILKREWNVVKNEINKFDSDARNIKWFRKE